MDGRLGKDICYVVESGAEDDDNHTIDNFLMGVMIVYLNMLHSGVKHNVPGDWRCSSSCHYRR